MRADDEKYELPVQLLGTFATALDFRAYVDNHIMLTDSKPLPPDLAPKVSLLSQKGGFQREKNRVVINCDLLPQLVANGEPGAAELQSHVLSKVPAGARLVNFMVLWNVKGTCRTFHSDQGIFRREEEGGEKEEEEGERKQVFLKEKGIG